MAKAAGLCRGRGRGTRAAISPVRTAWVAAVTKAVLQAFVTECYAAPACRGGCGPARSAIRPIGGRSCATLLLAQGVDLRTIADILGHTNISMTADLYAHVAPELRRRAASPMDAALTGT